MRNTITRTFNKIAAACLVFNNGKIVEQEIIVPAVNNTTALAEKYIRKNPDKVNGKLVDVVSVKVISTLYGMDESDFINLAKKVDERSKETRGMISKTVNGYIGTLLYMDEKRKVCDKLVTFSKGEKLKNVAADNTPKGCKPIDIENVEETSALFVMSEADFIANSREMVDHQHYKIK